MPWAESEIESEGITVTLMDAVLDQPLVSAKLTVKLFGPMSETAGVPDRVPSGATVSQAGPQTLAKVNTSPAGVTAFVESEPE